MRAKNLLAALLLLAFASNAAAQTNSKISALPSNSPSDSDVATGLHSGANSNFSFAAIWAWIEGHLFDTQIISATSGSTAINAGIAYVRLTGNLGGGSTMSYALPAASSVVAGYEITIDDWSGTPSSTQTQTATVQSGDTLNGITNGTSVNSNPYSRINFISDGATGWNSKPSIGTGATGTIARGEGAGNPAAWVAGTGDVTYGAGGADEVVTVLSGHTPMTADNTNQGTVSAPIANKFFQSRGISATSDSSGVTAADLVVYSTATAGAVTTAGAAANRVIGVALTGGASAAVQVVTEGPANCFFDGSSTGGDIVIPSTTSAGKCHDTGSTAQPIGSQAIGIARTTHSGSGLESVSVFPLGYSPATPAFPPYQPNTWYLPFGPVGSSSPAATMTVGSTYCMPSQFPAVTIEALAVGMQTAGSSNMQIGIYANGTNNRPSSAGPIVTTSNIANNGSTGPISGTITQTSLPAGIYWFCVQSDDATMKLEALASGPSLSWMMGSSTLSNVLTNSGNTMGDVVSSGGAFGTWPTTGWTDELVLNGHAAFVAVEVLSEP